MCKKLQDGKREVQEISFDPSSERLKQDYMETAIVIKIVTYGQYT